jgi:hypothetical protein
MIDIRNQPLNTSDCEGAKRPPLGVKPCVLLHGHISDRQRFADVADAVYRYTTAGLYVLPIWWGELYCHALVPGSYIVDVTQNQSVFGGKFKGYLTVHFANGMTVLLVDSDEEQWHRVAQPLYDKYVRDTYGQ